MISKVILAIRIARLAAKAKRALAYVRGYAKGKRDASARHGTDNRDDGS